MATETRAQWDTAYINNLPDSAFLYVAPGGKKDAEGKTVPRSLRSFPYKDSSGNVDLPHLRNALARIPQSNVPAAAKAAAMKKAQSLLQSNNGGRSKEEFRAQTLGDYEIREEGDAPILAGHLAVFNDWTEINSYKEGHFLEQIAPSAFDKTIEENRDRMRVLFQHGKDPALGEQPLGKIVSLEPDERGLAYEVELFDGIPPLVMSGLREGAYGSSFRFEVLREHRERRPERSEHNPRRLPERTVKEVRMSEFGPVTFPAYAGATAGLRSITDRMLLERVDTEDLDCLAQMIQLGSCYLDEQDEPGDEVNVPKMEAVLATLVELSQYELDEEEPDDEPEDEEMSSAHERAADATNAPPKDRAGDSHPIYSGRRVERDPLYVGRREESPAWKL